MKRLKNWSSHLKALLLISDEHRLVTCYSAKYILDGVNLLVTECWYTTWTWVYIPYMDLGLDMNMDRHIDRIGYKCRPICILVSLWQQGLSGWCVVGSCGDILLAVILHWTHITYRRTPAVVYFGMWHWACTAIQNHSAIITVYEVTLHYITMACTATQYSGALQYTMQKYRVWTSAVNCESLYDAAQCNATE